jgi:hypothetical protein
VAGTVVSVLADMIVGVARHGGDQLHRGEERHLVHLLPAVRGPAGHQRHRPGRRLRHTAHDGRGLAELLGVAGVSTVAGAATGTALPLLLATEVQMVFDGLLRKNLAAPAPDRPPGDWPLHTCVPGRVRPRSWPATSLGSRSSTGT